VSLASEFVVVAFSLSAAAARASFRLALRDVYWLRLNFFFIGLGATTLETEGDIRGAPATDGVVTEGDWTRDPGVVNSAGVTSAPALRVELGKVGVGGN